MAVNDQLLDQAGIRSSLTGEISRLTQRRETEQQRAARLSEAALETVGEERALIEARSRATAPLRDELSARLDKPSPPGPREEPILTYERPRLEPQELQESFGALFAASMLVGLSSRHPFYGAMAAMTGALKGFQEADDKIVEQSLKQFRVNLDTIKEKNLQKRREYEDILKGEATDLGKMKTRLELAAAKYDDPLAQLASQQKSLSEMAKVHEQNIRSIDSMVARMEQTLSRFETELGNQQVRREIAAGQRADAAARREEASARRDETQAWRELMFESKQEKETRDRHDREVRLLRSDMRKELAPLEKNLQLLNEVRQELESTDPASISLGRSRLQRYHGGTQRLKADIAELKNFGHIEERTAGWFNHWFAGKPIGSQVDQLRRVVDTLIEKATIPRMQAIRNKYRQYGTNRNLDVQMLMLDFDEGGPTDPIEREVNP